MTDVLIDARRGAGSNLEILYGTVTWKPTLAHSRSTSIVLPAPTTYDLVDGQAVATNVQPTPEPVAGQVEWAYEVTFKDRHSKSYSFLVGVPDSTSQVNFTSLPRYFETKPPLFGQGPQGEQGEAATVAVGTVAGGTTAQVTNSGTNTNAVLNFTLPKGDKGDTGAGVPSGGSALQVIRKNAGNTATEWATLNKASVGLTNVDNTSDANKPVSSAQSSAIDAYGKLSNSSKLVTDEPTSYTTAFSTVLGRVSDGWPQLGSSGNYTQVTTMRSANNWGGVLQVLSAHDDTSAPLQYRVSSGGNNWGAFRELVSSDALREAEAFVNIKSFGAVGDGVTDDRIAIQAAIDATVSTSQGVYVPSGTWRIGAPLRSPQGNLHLRLHPSAEIQKHGSNAMFVNGVQKSTVAGGNNIIIEGGVWNCRGIANGTDGSIFALGLGENIVIRNLTAKNVNLSHIAEIAACTNVLFENIKFGGFGSTLVKEAFQIERMSSTGFPYFNLNTGEHCKNIRLVRCTQISPDSGYNRWPVAVGNHANQAVQGADGVRIQDCDFGVCTDAVLYLDHFTNVSIDGVTGQGGAVSVFQSDKARKNNYTVNNLRITNSSGNGVVLRNLINVNITNSEFSGAYAVWITGCEDVVLENVGAYATDWDAVIVQQASGYTNPQKNISLTDLKVSGNHGVAIAGAAEVDGVTITRLRTVSRLGGMGVSVGGSAKNVSVRDSYFLSPIGASATIRIQNSSKVIAVGNRYTLGTPLTNATSQIVESSNTTIE